MTPAPTNGEISDLLARHGRLLEVAGESPFRTRAYLRAAEALLVHPEPLHVLAAEGRLREIPGIGEGIAGVIAQILQTGHFAAHDALVERIPESVTGLTEVPGIGAKTALRLYQELGIDSVGELEAALVSGKIRETKGFGAGSERAFRAGIEALQRRTGRVPLGVALPIARAFSAGYANARPHDQISVAGSARRWDITVGDLDFVVASTDVADAASAIAALPAVISVQSVTDNAIRLRLAGDLDADVYLTSPGEWGSTLVRATGNALHLERLGDIAPHAPTEADVYAAHGLPWIPPELRQGRDEFEHWASIPSLVTLADIQGEFHAHTTWSDGAASIAAMAEAAADRGYSFLGITDHSHGLGVAGGLNVDRLLQQRVEIEDANGVSGVRLLAGAEVEVHRDGSLDYPDAVLAELDVVVASLHTGLRRPSVELTDRLVRVLENPNVDIIAHPSGRLIERREGGDFDWERVFTTAARTGTALEINADPARLDLDPFHARQANDAGCLITINCDAHHPAGFAVMEYGVMMARKAWLKPDQILNCRPRNDVLHWLRARNRPR